MYDVIIKKATIIDGTRKDRYKGDVAIIKGRIKKIGKLENARAQLTVNANNLYLAPGFIDLNNHSDTHLTIFTISDLESMLRQGVTTVLGGNCGSSLAPFVSAEMLKSVQKWVDISEINLNWLTFGEFLEEVKRRKIGVNFGSLVGHSTLRRGILGDDFRKLKPKELEIVKNLLRKALRQGAFGLSTGLAYSHAKIASTEEIVELVKVVKKYNGIYATHIRGEAEELLPAIKETITVGKKTNVSVEISHLKAMGRRFWSNMKQAIELIEKAHKDNININFDVYPYTITGSVLYILLPDWVAEGGKKMLLKRLKNEKIKQKVIKEMQKKKDYEYDKITIASSPIDRSFIGKKITEIASAQGIGVEEAIINMLISSEGRVITFLDTLSDENLERVISNKLSFVASDGAGYDKGYYVRKGDLVHPRNFGAFPRFLGRYVRGKKLLNWEEAIYKITAGPARKLGLKSRGLVKNGYWADLVLFDPKKIIDKASFENPYQYSEGIKYVFVNGELAVEGGEYNGIRAGQVLRRS